MFNATMYDLGNRRSCIRELFEFGLKQASLVGKDNVYDYSLGNPSIPAPVQVNAAIKDIVENEPSLKVHGYTPAIGTPAVREAVAKDLNDRFGTSIRPENLLFTSGAAPALVATLKALNLDENTEVVAIAPHFPEYRPFIENTGNRFVLVQASSDFQIDVAAFEKALNVNTQAVIVNSPNNPSGAVYTRETLEKLAEVLTRKSQELGHPIYLIADEPYRELVYDGIEVPFIPSIYKDTIVCYSWSKSLSLPGERIGYICIPDQVTDHAELFKAVAGAARIIGHVCASSLMQHVITRCVHIRPNLDAYAQNRALLYDALTQMGYECVPPDGAFYLFVKAPGGDAQAFSEACKAYNLLVVPSEDFGLKGYFRLSYCVSHDMIKRSLPFFAQAIEPFK